MSKKTNVVRVDFEKLARRAKEERWSPFTIAKSTGLNPATIGLIFQGKSDPQASNLKRICDTIGLPIEEAFVSDAAAA
jgi:transcriptional regulator with XRE-family HTH domain